MVVVSGSLQLGKSFRSKGEGHLGIRSKNRRIEGKGRAQEETRRHKS